MPCKQWWEEAVGRGLLLQLLTLEVNKSGSARSTIVTFLCSRLNIRNYHTQKQGNRIVEPRIKVNHSRF